MQSRERIQDDIKHHARVIYTNALGAEYLKKPGRRKRLTAGQAATLFEMQVQIRAANKAIDRILAEAKYNRTKAARARILCENWKDRGRIDVIHPSAKKARR